MPEAYLTGEDSLREMLGRWMKERTVIAPVKSVAGDVLFESIDDPAACELDFVIQSNSPRELLLPQSETLMVYKLGDRASVREVVETERRLLFGVRPCDMSALNAVCAAMSAQPPDRYCVTRAKNLTSVVLTCPSVFTGHFCHLTGTGPWLTEGFDCQITQIGAQFLIEIGSPQGLRLLDEVRDLVVKAEPRLLTELDRLRAETAPAKRRDVDMSRARRLLAERLASETFCQDLAGRCQSCGGCSFVCPTCSCFSIVDVPQGPAAGERTRQWDSCAFAGFTRLAGGHNPAAGKVSRLQRRLLHKFQGSDCEPGGSRCVGCGRCSGACLGEIDIAEILRRVIEDGGAS